MMEQWLLLLISRLWLQLSYELGALLLSLKSSGSTQTQHEVSEMNHPELDILGFKPPRHHPLHVGAYGHDPGEPCEAWAGKYVAS